MAGSRLQQTSWALFDFANSAFPTVITTFVFAAYFSKGIAPDEVTGTALWGYATSIAAFFIALCAPVFGAIADQSGARKPWIFLFSFLCVSGSALLWFATPEESSIVFALTCVGLATFGFEMAMVFYNAMLPGLATPGREGLLSGLSWGLGYLGGLLALALVLVLFVQNETPLFGLDKTLAEHLRISGPFVALWYSLFACALFLFVPDRQNRTPVTKAVSKGLATLKSTLKGWRDHPDIFFYLLTRMIYTDGLNTLFAFGGIYAAGTFDMAFSELIIFGIGINVTAGLGAAGFGWLDDRLGPKRVIIIALISISLIASGTLLVSDKTHFLILGLSLGLFMGPAQAASRTYMAHISPKEIRTELFGLYALSGKATAFIGPLLVGVMTEIFASQRAGMATILIFFVIGLACMRNLPDIRGQRDSI
ncbi:Major facilitator superfamily MFS_1 [Candidatus Terasakiella magnetica]|uniref:Major facilitator superfamily MFS_1 n=1 Tax=Candidatus Terasakiella magnetica TaxID=1867952 RepID=A0A1C3RGT6_9PROT|nr:MFS transporter [Candidatus Terasakiella magnetica]SCA56475.1 Major facilitator superfamily MFS_1 [Candidatus Terasakiella magnetica]